MLLSPGASIPLNHPGSILPTNSYSSTLLASSGVTRKTLLRVGGHASKFGHDIALKRAKKDWGRAALKPTDHESSPFAELGVREIWDGIGRTRVRQHVNPLRSQYQIPTGPLDWSSMFGDPQRPLVVDLGCGPGRFLLLMHHRHARQLELQQQHHQQQQQPAEGQESSGSHRQWVGLSPRGSTMQPMNYLGIEIRQALVERANTWAARLGCEQDVQFVYSNATISLATMLSSYPGPVRLVCIQFPDPHFKRRNHKRRIFQPNLVKDVASLLEPGGCVLLQSDVEPVSVAMRNMFEHQGGQYFEVAPEHSSPGAVFFGAPAAHAEQEAHKQGGPGAGHEGPQTGDGQQPAASASSSGPAPGAPSAAHGAAGGQWAEGTGAAGSSEGPGAEAVAGHGGTHASEVFADGQDRSQASDEGEAWDGEAGGLQEGGEQEGQPGGARQKDAEGDWENMDSQWAAAGWLMDNPMGVPTEREFYVQQQQLPVYRVLLVRK